MVSFSQDQPIIFILGAGFCVDAASEAGNPTGVQGPAKYPIVSELLKVCFAKDSLPPEKSIEDLFQECIDKNNREPIKRLYDILMEADYFITPNLKMGGSREENVYMRFLDDFPISPLITFNYDSFPEILLLSKKVWRPEDGYGVFAKTKFGFGSDQFKSSLPKNSKRLILHLHGVLCVYPDEFYIEYEPDSIYGALRERENPIYIFDPDKITHCFTPYVPIPPTDDFKYPEFRVLAPVPNKSKGLNSIFIQEVYRQAKALIGKSKMIVVIGYSFNTNDKDSYLPLLKVAVNRRILVVSPNSGSLVMRLKDEYPDINWGWKDMSFKEWVLKKYPGI